MPASRNQREVTASENAVTSVTQARVGSDKAPAFERWQRRAAALLATFPGHLDGEVLAPSPPVQVDWVIIDRFIDSGAARAWLNAPGRQALLTDLQPLLAGPLDVHLFASGDRRPAPVSVIIATHLKPGQEDAFLSWQRRVAAVQAKFEGFQGYKLEPPLPGVQDDWVIVLRFDSDENLDAWLTSPERRQLLEQAKAFDARSDIRKVRSGFEVWFSPDVEASRPPPTWKQNLLVLLVLYPLVFLFGKWCKRHFL